MLKKSSLLIGAALFTTFSFNSMAADFEKIAHEVIPAYYASTVGKCLDLSTVRLGGNAFEVRETDDTIFLEKTEDSRILELLIARGIFTKEPATYSTMTGFNYTYTDKGKSYVKPGAPFSLCVGAASLVEIVSVADKVKRSFGQESVPVVVKLEYKLVPPFSDPEVKNQSHKRMVKNPLLKYDGKKLTMKGKIYEKDGQWRYQESPTIEQLHGLY